MTVEVVETKTISHTVWCEVQCRACWQTWTFINPTNERIRWYKDSHRCGGEGWQDPR